MDLITFFRYSDIISIVIPILLGVSYINNAKIENKIFTSFLGLVLISNITLIILAINGINTEIASKLYHIIEYIMISWFYLQLLSNRLKRGKIMYVSLFIVLIILLFTTISIHTGNPYDFISSTINSITFLVLSLITIQVSSFSNKKVDSGVLIINYGVLLYSFTTIAIILFSDFLLKENESTFRYIWIISNIISILTNLIFALGLWKSRKLALQHS